MLFVVCIGEGADPTRPQCRKAKDIRREKKMAKIAATGDKQQQKQVGRDTSKSL